MDTSGATVRSPWEGARRWALPAGVVLLIGLELVLVAAHPRLPTNDGPSHQYSAWVAHRLARDSDDPLSAAFELNPRRIYPNVAYSWFLEALAGLVPMSLAERLGAALFLIGLPLCVAVFSRALGREPWLSALAAAALSLGFPFFMGFFNFLWGVPLTFLFWAALVRNRERSGLRHLVTPNLLLALTFCAHLVAFAVAVAGSLALIASMPRKRSWRTLAGVLPVVALAPLFWPRTLGPGAELTWTEGPLARLAATLTLGVATGFGGAERTAAAIIGVSATAVLAIGLVRRSRSVAPGAAALALALLGLALFAPSAVGSGSFLPERLMLYFWLAAAVAVAPRGARVRAATAWTLGALALAHLAFLETRFRRFDAEMTTYLSALDRIPEGSAIYTFVHARPHEDFVTQPMATASCHYHLALESANFDLYQASPPDAPFFPIRFTPSARRRFPRQVPRGRVALGRASGWADYLLLWNAPARELARIGANGNYRLEFENAPLRLYRRRSPGRPLRRAGSD